MTAISSPPPKCSYYLPSFYNEQIVNLFNDATGYQVVIYLLIGLNVAHIYFHMIMEHSIVPSR